jgi:hypothetical protein
MLVLVGLPPEGPKVPTVRGPPEPVSGLWRWLQYLKHLARRPSNGSTPACRSGARDGRGARRGGDDGSRLGICELLVARVERPPPAALVARNLWELERCVIRTVIMIIAVTSLEVIVEPARRIEQLEIVGASAMPSSL